LVTSVFTVLDEGISMVIYPGSVNVMGKEYWTTTGTPLFLPGSNRAFFTVFTAV